jgi:hypothetical protein
MNTCLARVHWFSRSPCQGGYYVRRKLPLPREPDGAILKEGTNLYWVAKLQGAVERQYSFYADSCSVKIHVIL